MTSSSFLLTDHYLSEIDDDLTSITDFNLLKYQLVHQRESLSSTLGLLIEAELSYTNVVPRADYENLLHEKNLFSQEYNLLKREYKYLGQACLYLINKTRDLIDERNNYYYEWQTNRALLTPRPDWDKASNVIDGGIERWKVLSSEKSSDQLVDILINEITNENDTQLKHDQDYFDSIDNDTSVYPFLRMPTGSQVFNRRMRRRITGLLIKEIWNDRIRGFKTSSPQNLTKRNEDNREKVSSAPLSPRPEWSPVSLSDTDSNQATKTLADHVAAYFRKRFDSHAIAIEMSYNLSDACQRYRYSEQINLFWGIVTGQIEEMVYHHQMKSISQLLQHLMKMKKIHSLGQQREFSKPRQAIVDEFDTPWSIDFNYRLSSPSLSSLKEQQESIVFRDELTMTKEQFLDALEQFYPHKSSSQIDELFQSAKRDLHYPNDIIEFTLLFVNDDEARHGEFLSTLIKQIHQEKILYVEQVKQILLGYPLITVSQFCRAISIMDPNISSNELQRYVQWVFSVGNLQPSQHTRPLDLEDLLKRLENCACFKH